MTDHLPPTSVAARAADPAFASHEGGKLAVASRVPLDGPADLSLAYTPGVGRVSQAIAEDRSLVWRYTGRRNTVAVLTNGTAVLGLGDIGPEAALPVMGARRCCSSSSPTSTPIPSPSRPARSTSWWRSAPRW